MAFLLEVQIPVSTLIASVITLIYIHKPLLLSVARAGATIQTYSLIAIPMFIPAGEILADGSLSERIISFVEALIGWMTGGLAMVNILASTFFGGISGSPLADISSLGTVLCELPVFFNPQSIKSRL